MHPYPPARHSGGAIVWLALAVALAFPALAFTVIGTAWAVAAPVLTTITRDLPAATRPSSSPHHDGGGRVARPSGLTFTATHGCRPAADWRSGRLDPRVRTLLTRVASKHRVRVSCLHAGHSRFVKGTRRVSNHTVWRAVDIDMVGGRPVSRRNPAAARLAVSIGRGAFGVQPSEVGSPWSFGHRPWFSDAGHQGHLHVGFGGR